MFRRWEERRGEDGGRRESGVCRCQPSVSCINVCSAESAGIGQHWSACHAPPFPVTFSLLLKNDCNCVSVRWSPNTHTWWYTQKNNVQSLWPCSRHPLPTSTTEKKRKHRGIDLCLKLSDFFFTHCLLTYCNFLRTPLSPCELLPGLMPQQMGSLSSTGCSNLLSLGTAALSIHSLATSLLVVCRQC